MNRIERLTGTLLLLQGGKRTAGEIARRFEVSRRTVRRDIQALCEMGMPIAAGPGVSGGYTLPTDYSLPPLALTWHEAALLRLALSILSQLGSTPFRPEREPFSYHGKWRELMSNKPRFAFIVEYVKNVEEAKRFYVEVLGLEVERSHPTFVQFGGFAIAGDQSLTGTEEPEVYWLVDDAEAAFNDLAQRAEIYRPLEQMAFGRVFGIEDPAGRTRFLLEWAKDRPSRPVK